MAESDVQAEIMLACGRLPGVRLFRNSVGQGWSGHLRGRQGNLVILENARPIRYGLMPGSADLIGWRSLVVTPEMVGTRIAQLVSLEVKTLTGTAADHQKNWLSRTTEAGACSAVVRSPEAALQALSTPHHGDTK